MKPDLHRSTLRCREVYFPVQGHTESVCVQTRIRTPKPSSNWSGLAASEEDGGIPARSCVPVLLGKESCCAQATWRFLIISSWWTTAGQCGVEGTAEPSS